MSRIEVTIQTEDWEAVIFERNDEKLRVEIAEAEQGKSGCATLSADDYALIYNVLSRVKTWIIQE